MCFNRQLYRNMQLSASLKPRNGRSFRILWLAIPSLSPKLSSHTTIDFCSPYPVIGYGPYLNEYQKMMVNLEPYLFRVIT